jgi:ketosteroid isomerase-like protein
LRILRLLLAVAALAGVALLAERLFSSDEEEVKDRVVALAEAIERGDVDRFGAILADDFRFESEDPLVGSGDRAAALARARRATEEASHLGIRIERIRADLEGDAATVEAEGQGWALGAGWGRRSFEVLVELRRDAEGEWLAHRATVDWVERRSGPTALALSIVSAVLEEDFETIEALLAPDFRYTSPDAEIGSGDRAEALARLREFLAGKRALELADPEVYTDRDPFFASVRIEGPLSWTDEADARRSRRISAKFELRSEGGAARVSQVEIDLR